MQSVTMAHTNCIILTQIITIFLQNGILYGMDVQPKLDSITFRRDDVIIVQGKQYSFQEFLKLLLPLEPAPDLQVDGRMVTIADYLENPEDSNLVLTMHGNGMDLDKVDELRGARDIIRVRPMKVEVDGKWIGLEELVREYRKDLMDRVQISYLNGEEEIYYDQQRISPEDILNMVFQKGSSAEDVYQILYYLRDDPNLTLRFDGRTFTVDDFLREYPNGFSGYPDMYYGNLKITIEQLGELVDDSERRAHFRGVQRAGDQETLQLGSADISRRNVPNSINENLQKPEKSANIGSDQKQVNLEHFLENLNEKVPDALVLYNGAKYSVKEFRQKFKGWIPKNFDLSVSQEAVTPEINQALDEFERSGNTVMITTQGFSKIIHEGVVYTPAEVIRALAWQNDAGVRIMQGNKQYRPKEFLNEFKDQLPCDFTIYKDGKLVKPTDIPDIVDLYTVTNRLDDPAEGLREKTTESVNNANPSDYFDQFKRKSGEFPQFVKENPEQIMEFAKQNPDLFFNFYKQQNLVQNLAQLLQLIYQNPNLFLYTIQENPEQFLETLSNQDSILKQNDDPTTNEAPESDSNTFPSELRGFLAQFKSKPNEFQEFVKQNPEHTLEFAKRNPEQFFPFFKNANLVQNRNNFMQLLHQYPNRFLYTLQVNPKRFLETLPKQDPDLKQNDDGVINEAPGSDSSQFLAQFKNKPGEFQLFVKQNPGQFLEYAKQNPDQFFSFYKTQNLLQTPEQLMQLLLQNPKVFLYALQANPQQFLETLPEQVVFPETINYKGVPYDVIYILQRLTGMDEPNLNIRYRGASYKPGEFLPLFRDEGDMDFALYDGEDRVEPDEVMPRIISSCNSGDSKEDVFYTGLVKELAKRNNSEEDVQVLQRKTYYTPREAVKAFPGGIPHGITFYLKRKPVEPNYIMQIYGITNLNFTAQTANNLPADEIIPDSKEADVKYADLEPDALLKILSRDANFAIVQNGKRYKPGEFGAVYRNGTDFQVLMNDEPIQRKNLNAILGPETTPLPNTTTLQNVAVPTGAILKKIVRKLAAKPNYATVVHEGWFYSPETFLRLFPDEIPKNTHFLISNQAVPIQRLVQMLEIDQDVANRLAEVKHAGPEILKRIASGANVTIISNNQRFTIPEFNNLNETVARDFQVEVNNQVLNLQELLEYLNWVPQFDLVLKDVPYLTMKIVQALTKLDGISVAEKRGGIKETPAEFLEKSPAGEFEIFEGNKNLSLAEAVLLYDLNLTYTDDVAKITPKSQMIGNSFGNVNSRIGYPPTVSISGIIFKTPVVLRKLLLTASSDPMPGLQISYNGAYHDPAAFYANYKTNLPTDFGFTRGERELRLDAVIEGLDLDYMLVEIISGIHDVGTSMLAQLKDKNEITVVYQGTRYPIGEFLEKFGYMFNGKFFVKNQSTNLYQLIHLYNLSCDFSTLIEGIKHVKTTVARGLAAVDPDGLQIIQNSVSYAPKQFAQYSGNVTDYDIELWGKDLATSDAVFLYNLNLSGAIKEPSFGNEYFRKLLEQAPKDLVVVRNGTEYTLQDYYKKFSGTGLGNFQFSLDGVNRSPEEIIKAYQLNSTKIYPVIENGEEFYKPLDLIAWLLRNNPNKINVLLNSGESLRPQDFIKRRRGKIPQNIGFSINGNRIRPEDQLKLMDIPALAAEGDDSWPDVVVDDVTYTKKDIVKVLASIQSDCIRITSGRGNYTAQEFYRIFRNQIPVNFKVYLFEIATKPWKVITLIFGRFNGDQRKIKQAIASVDFLDNTTTMDPSEPSHMWEPTSTGMDGSSDAGNTQAMTIGRKIPRLPRQSLTFDLEIHASPLDDDSSSKTIFQPSKSSLDEDIPAPSTPPPFFQSSKTEDEGWNPAGFPTNGRYAEMQGKRYGFRDLSVSKETNAGNTPNFETSNDSGKPGFNQRLGGGFTVNSEYQAPFNPGFAGGFVANSEHQARLNPGYGGFARNYELQAPAFAGFASNSEQQASLNPVLGDGRTVTENQTPLNARFDGLALLNPALGGFQGAFAMNSEQQAPGFGAAAPSRDFVNQAGAGDFAGASRLYAIHPGLTRRTVVQTSHVIPPRAQFSFMSQKPGSLVENHAHVLTRSFY